ncbi:MAG: hypothetical protein HZB99_04555 [Candidatus Harrisonbacteria bacterium]|nr:hypothetical protein [Candidatus Harrisonbacteria bacterium]
MKTERGVVPKPCFDPLPKGLVMSKPLQQGTFKEEVVYQLERERRLIITRKRDGWKLFAVKANGKWKIYTDGINEVDCLDHIKAELQKLNLPNQTMLVGEGIVDLENGDDRGKVISIMQSDKEKALRFQLENGYMRLMIFQVIFLGGQCRLTDPYEKQLELISQILQRTKPQHIIPVPVMNMTYDEAKALVKKNKAVNEHAWEGLVLYAKDFTGSYRLDGKSPARPKGCYKWKPIYEDDFVVRSLVLNDKTGLVKEVCLSQVDPKTGKEFSCGKFGLFTVQMRKELLSAKLPLVIQLKFEGRFKSGKLNDAKLVDFRTDKKPEDCIAPKSYAAK